MTLNERIFRQRNVMFEKKEMNSYTNIFFLQNLGEADIIT